MNMFLYFTRLVIMLIRVVGFRPTDRRTHHSPCVSFSEVVANSFVLIHWYFHIAGNGISWVCLIPFNIPKFLIASLTTNDERLKTYMCLIHPLRSSCIRRGSSLTVPIFLLYNTIARISRFSVSLPSPEVVAIELDNCLGFIVVGRV